MKEVIINKENLKEEDINKRAYRARALLINSDNEILLGFCENTYQFPGGHVDEGETLAECLKREVLEETGITMEDKDYTPFYVIRYYSRNHPEEGTNKYTELNYFIVETDQKYDLDKIDLDEWEIEQNFELRYVKLDDFEEVLNKTLKDNEKNTIVYPELLKIIDEYKRLQSK